MGEGLKDGQLRGLGDGGKGMERGIALGWKEMAGETGGRGARVGGAEAGKEGDTEAVEKTFCIKGEGWASN